MKGSVESEDTIKGTPTIVSRDWIDERLGEGWFHATIIKECPSWPTRLLPGDFYPLRPQMHVWYLAESKIPNAPSVERMVSFAAGITAERDLNSIYKAFLWAASPQLFLRAVPRLWSSYVRFGELETTENVPGRYKATISGVPNDLLDWATGAVVGFLRPALLLAGGKDPKSEITSRRPGTSKKISDFDYQLTYHM